MFSNTLLLLIKIPLLIASWRIIAITLGTARPKAQGQDATNTLIPRSNIQQTLQPLYYTISKVSNNVQTTTVAMLNRITPLTKTFEIC